jgi:hypothetical protein
MSSPYAYNLPATAICPGCQTMVVLPAEPLYEDTPPAICGECGSEVPDYRRESSTPESDAQSAAGTGYVLPTPQEEKPLADQRYTRRNLFRSLGGIVAEKGIVKIEEAKSRFTD